MKLVVAFIQPAIEERVIAALHTIAGVTGATVSDARGFGRGDPRERVTPETLFGVAPRRRVDVLVDDSIARQVVETIAVAAHTGQRGDGKVFVLPVLGVTRIGSGTMEGEVT